MRASIAKPDPGRIKVWDPVVRLGHWLLVAGFFTAWLTEDDLDALHAWAGYVVGAVVVVRLAWGVIGTRHARFTDFVFGPATARRYLASLFTRNPVHYVGHNPLGGWMVIALLVMLTLTTWTGLEAYAVEGKGPLAAGGSLLGAALANGAGRRGEDSVWEELHEACAEFTLFLVVLHIAGVLFSSIVHRENLVAGMITGYKMVPPPAAGDSR